MDCSRCSATAAVVIDRVAAAQDIVAGSVTEHDDVAARECAAAASKCSGVVAGQLDNGLFAVAEVAAIAVCGFHRCGSNRDCDQSSDDSNRGCDQTVDDSRFPAVVGVPSRDLTVAGVIVRGDVALRSVVAVDVASPTVAGALASFEFDPRAAVPSVAVAPGNPGSGPGAAVPNVVAAPDSAEFDSGPDAVAPNAAVVPENCGSGPAAVVPNVAVVPENCGSDPDAVVVPDSHAVVPAVVLLHAAVVPTVVALVRLVADFDAALVLLVVAAGVGRAQPDFARCAPDHVRAGLVRLQR